MIGLISLIKQRNECMNNDIIELLGFMKEFVEEKYSGSDYIVLYNKFIKAIEEVKEKLDLVDELENKIDDLEADNERLEEEKYELEGKVEYWQDEYYVLEQQYEKLQ